MDSTENSAITQSHSSADRDWLAIHKEKDQLRLEVKRLTHRLELAERVQSKHEVLQMFRDRADGAVYPSAALDESWEQGRKAQMQVDEEIITRNGALIELLMELTGILNFLAGACWVSESLVLQQLVQEYATPYRDECNEKLKLHEYITLLVLRLPNLIRQTGVPIEINAPLFAEIAIAVEIGMERRWKQRPETDPRPT